MLDNEKTKDGNIIELSSPQEVSYSINKFKSRLKYSRNKESQLEALKSLDLKLRDYDGEMKRLTRAIYLGAGDQAADKKKKKEDIEVKAFSWHIKRELSETFSSYSHPDDRQLESLVGPAYQAEIEREVLCFQPYLFDLLIEEEKIVDEQMACFAELNLSRNSYATPLGKLRFDLQNISRRQRLNSYENFLTKVENKRQETLERFLDLHKLRRELAEKSGFSSFEQYQVRRLGINENLHKAIPQFHSQVAAHFMPLVKAVAKSHAARLDIEEVEPHDYLLLSQFGTPELAQDAYPLVDSFIACLGEIIEKQVGYFSELKEAGELIIKPTEASNVSDYSDRIKIRSKIEDKSYTLYLFQADTEKSTIILYNYPQELIVERLFNLTGKVLLDLSEIFHNKLYLPRLPHHYERDLAAYSLALLSYKSWDKFYGHMSEYAREWMYIKYLLDVPRLTALDKMERFLATSSTTNINHFSQFWRKCSAEFNINENKSQLFSFISDREAYLYSPALWTKPLSAIYQGLSLIQALSAFPFRRYNHTLEENLLRFLNFKSRNNPLARALTAGYVSPFNRDSFRKASFVLSNKLGL